MYITPFLKALDIADENIDLCPLPYGEIAWQFTEEIKRSRFITSICHVESPEKAREYVAFLQKKYADATHNCWAYHIGAPDDTSRVGYSDDGEPHGTAGRPMLTQIEGSGMGDVLAVVTRYFGGVKLGTGGLVRAYQGGVKNALEKVPRKEKIPLAFLAFSMPTAQCHVLHQVLGQEIGKDVHLLEEAYCEGARFHVELPESQTGQFKRFMTDATRGQIEWLE